MVLFSNALAVLHVRKIVSDASLGDLEKGSVLETVRHILKHGSIPENASLSDTCLSILLISCISLRTIRRIVENCGNVLENCLLYLPSSYIYELCSDWLPVLPIGKLVVEGKVSSKLAIFYDVAVPITSFLRYVRHRVYTRRLCEHYVARGFVLVAFRDYVWATLDSVITWLEEKASRLRPYLPQTLLEELEKEAKYITYYTHLQYQDYGSNSRSIHPPCIQALLKALEDGEDLPHHARFVIASYMLHYLVDYLGKSREEAVETVVQLFRKVPDFNEKITRYQVQHIAGLVGGRKFYLPPNCDELKSLGLCPTEGKCGVKNPLAYVLKRLKGSKKH